MGLEVSMDISELLQLLKTAVKQEGLAPGRLGADAMLRALAPNARGLARRFKTPELGHRLGHLQGRPRPTQHHHGRNEA